MLDFIVMQMSKVNREKGYITAHFKVFFIRIPKLDSVMMAHNEPNT